MPDLGLVCLSGPTRHRNGTFVKHTTGSLVSPNSTGPTPMKIRDDQVGAAKSILVMLMGRNIPNCRLGKGLPSATAVMLLAGRPWKINRTLPAPVGVDGSKARKAGIVTSRTLGGVPLVRKKKFQARSAKMPPFGRLAFWQLAA